MRNSLFSEVVIASNQMNYETIFLYVKVARNFSISFERQSETENVPCDWIVFSGEKASRVDTSGE